MSAVPLTRDLDALIAACMVVEAELDFQAERLENVDPRRSGSDPMHLVQMQQDYRHGSSIVARLRRYQESRRTRMRKDEPDPAEPTWDVFPEMAPDTEGFVDSDGRATAYVES
jgi:hypothetical protein